MKFEAFSSIRLEETSSWRSKVDILSEISVENSMKSLIEFEIILMSQTCVIIEYKLIIDNKSYLRGTQRFRVTIKISKNL